MGSNFELAIPVILRHEGGYCWVEGDAGGETNFGISKRSYPDIDIKNLTSADASVIYKRDWWDHYGYGRIDAQMLATKIFDTAVNIGPKPAHRIAQKAVGVIVDGILGIVSISAINASQPAQLLSQLQNRQAAYYEELVSYNPNLSKFLVGWMNRAFDRD